MRSIKDRPMPRLPWGTDESARPRDLSIETLRGLAIVLMVAGHVVGSNPELGMRVAPDSAYRYFYDSLMFLRMPLFTVISGFVYAMRPLDPGRVPPFLAGKARRLLVPFATVATLQFAAKAAVPDVHVGAEWRDLWQIYLFPFDQFWFVQALALIFLAIALLDGFGLMRTPARWLCVCAVALGLHFFLPHLTTLFALPNALYLLPYFLLGVGLRRFAGVLSRRGSTLAAVAAFAIAFGAHQLSLLGLWEVRFRHDGVVALIIGACGCFLLFRARFRAPGLAWVGSYAYSIYLLHIFATSGSRVVLERLRLDHHALVFAVGLAAGIAGPIAADRVLRRRPLTRLLFLGLSPRPRRVRTAEAPERDPEALPAPQRPVVRTESGAFRL